MMRNMGGLGGGMGGMGGMDFGKHDFLFSLLDTKQAQKDLKLVLCDQCSAQDPDMLDLGVLNLDPRGKISTKNLKKNSKIPKS